MTYYGLSLNTGDLPGSVYVNFISSGLIEIPGYIITVPMLEYWGRKPSVILMWLLGGAGCILSGIIPQTPDTEIFIVILAMIGKISVAAAFAVIYNYTTEVFPTTIRHTATGLCSLFSRIGAMAAPQVHLLSNYGPHWIPIVIYGAFALAAAALDFFLPETRGQPMAENIPEFLRLAQGKSIEKEPTIPLTDLSSSTEKKSKY